MKIYEKNKKSERQIVKTVLHEHKLIFFNQYKKVKSYDDYSKWICVGHSKEKGCLSGFKSKD